VKRLLKRCGAEVEMKVEEEGRDGDGEPRASKMVHLVCVVGQVLYKGVARRRRQRGGGEEALEAEGIVLLFAAQPQRRGK
jgi:hypothetical protein